MSGRPPQSSAPGRRDASQTEARREPSVFVARRLADSALDRLRQAGVRVEIGQDDDGHGLDRADLLDGIRRCDVLLPLLTEAVDRQALTANPDLLGVAQSAVGYDNIDLAAATELGIPVSNTPGVLTETCADFTWALLLAVARRIPEAHAFTVRGRYRIWGAHLMLGADVGPGADGRAKVLGIVGYGRIGEAVARRARGFGMEILAYGPRSRPEIEADPKVQFAELDELFARSDFVSLHVPLDDSTRHLVNEARLRSMKPSAYLVNTARGPVVDEAALVRALGEGWIAGAALDVFEREPELAPGLAEAPNVVLAPHIASATVETRGRMAWMAADEALAHLAGRRGRWVVNEEVYDGSAYAERRARFGRASFTGA